MSIRQLQIEISEKDPFANCKLGRKKYADVLTNIVDSYSDGFVLAINNKWGTGKTTFVKMWQQDLQNKEYQTVYFNAWENDFDNNPLVAILGELKSLTKGISEVNYKKVLKKASILSKHIAPIILTSLLDKYLNTDKVKEGVKALMSGASEIFESEVDTYIEKKENIDDFRRSLSHFVANTSNGKPLIFIVDELDRCRPDYAVSILEQIKHFFSIPNIVFVLSIDKSQLKNIVKGVYGSENLDADEYLRRFIDIEYSIPKPEEGLYYKYLYEYFNFDEFFQSSDRVNPELSDDKSEFLQICNILFNKSNIPLRKQEKIFTLASLSLKTFSKNSYVIPYVYMFLIYLKIVHSDLYDSLMDKQLTLENAQSKLLEIISPSLNEDTERMILYLEAYLVIFYNNYVESRYNGRKIIQYNKETGKNELLIKSVITAKDDNEFFFIIENINRQGRRGNLSLEIFFNKIELLENFR